MRMLSSREHIAPAFDGFWGHAMPTLDDVRNSKRLYTAPQLTVHGTLTEITLMRFKWPDRGDWSQDPTTSCVS